jgi:hypothetical protein
MGAPEFDIFSQIFASTKSGSAMVVVDQVSYVIKNLHNV